MYILLVKQNIVEKVITLKIYSRQKKNTIQKYSNSLFKCFNKSKKSVLLNKKEKKLFIVKFKPLKYRLVFLLLIIKEIITN